jgi:Fuc2NAc and GlcNAc transferase
VIYVKLALLLLTFLGARIGTGGLRQYALRHQVVDVPNARSSHSVPTARGGGVAIVVGFVLAYVVWSCAVGGGSRGLLATLLPGSVVIAALGFWDDHRALSAKIRFPVHLLAACWAVYRLGGWPVLDLGFASFAWGWVGSVVAVLAIAWSINLYNFMDGIDGLAGMETVFVGGVGGLLVWYAGADGMPLWLLAAAAAGFLVMNWPPARIFMGDAGSGFLGYVFAVMALHATVARDTTIWPWVILLGVFGVDATLTLLRRAWRGIRVTDAHRTHAYQWAARRAGGHLPVTIGVLGLNLVLLAPAAWLVIVRPELSLPITGVCVVLLVGLAWKFDAGLPEKAFVADLEQTSNGTGTH